ncbi:hypothetical protein G7Y89_g14041 [Cudoniella acicularis]|uniref:Calcipressin n=1 Tax=Cudoniella acicularis TaxID=354080 RepID=A0A8H4VVH5_9HELO|nr:hypothetical protein G7Y89_g14041 [Cudoniella acicularis]
MRSHLTGDTNVWRLSKRAGREATFVSAVQGSRFHNARTPWSASSQPVGIILWGLPRCPLIPELPSFLSRCVGLRRSFTARLWKRLSSILGGEVACAGTWTNAALRWSTEAVQRTDGTNFAAQTLGRRQNRGCASANACESPLPTRPAAGRTPFGETSNITRAITFIKTFLPPFLPEKFSDSTTTSSLFATNQQELHYNFIAMASENTPDSSRPTSRASRSNMSIDLSSIPPLVQPTPPSNTLIITNLQDVEVFRPDNLQIIKDLINASAPIHSWAPLKSFRRIIVSFFEEDSAIRIRQILDGEAIMGERVKVYFGHPTSVEPKDEHLNLPDAGKLFFISPPPSPPHGWEMKLEDAPNKLVHAEDLAEALAKLHHRPRIDLPASPISDEEQDSTGRVRSNSTTIYNPSEHGLSPNLPAISVQDLTGEDDISPIETEKPILEHTSRPPVELMEF